MVSRIGIGFQKWRGVILITLANILFSINMPVSRDLIPDPIDPLALSLFRISFAFLSFFILSLKFKEVSRIELKDHFKLFLCGVFGTSLNQLSFLKGLSYTSPVDASLIITIGPIITMILAAIIIKEPLSFKKVVGVGVGLLGAALILYTAQNREIVQTGSIKGDLIVLISCFSYALYLVIVKPLMSKFNPVTVMKWSFFYGTITALPFCAKQALDINELPIKAVLNLGYALIFGTFIAYYLVSLSLKYLRPTTISMFNYIQPLLASTIAIYVGQDVMNIYKPIAAILIFAGVYLVITSKSKEELKKS